MHNTKKEEEHTKGLLNHQILESKIVLLEKNKLSEEKSELLNENQTLTKETESLNALIDKVVNGKNNQIPENNKENSYICATTFIPFSYRFRKQP